LRHRPANPPVDLLSMSGRCPKNRRPRVSATVITLACGSARSLGRSRRHKDPEVPLHAGGEHVDGLASHVGKHPERYGHILGTGGSAVDGDEWAVGLGQQPVGR